MYLFVQYGLVVQERKVVESSNLVEMLLLANGRGLSDVVSVAGEQGPETGSNRKSDANIRPRQDVCYAVNHSVEQKTVKLDRCSRPLAFSK